MVSFLFSKEKAQQTQPITAWSSVCLLVVQIRLNTSTYGLHFIKQYFQLMDGTKT